MDRWDVVIEKAELLADLRERLAGIELLRSKKPLPGLLSAMASLNDEIEKAKAEYEAAFSQVRQEI